MLTGSLSLIIMLVMINFSSQMQEGTETTPTPYPCYEPEIVTLWSKDGKYLAVVTRSQTLIYGLDNLIQPVQTLTGGCHATFWDTADPVLSINDQQWNIVTGEPFVHQSSPFLSPKGTYQIMSEFDPDTGHYTILTLKHLKDTSKADLQLKLDARWSEGIFIHILEFSADESLVAIPLYEYAPIYVDENGQGYEDPYPQDSAIYIWDLAADSLTAQIPGNAQNFTYIDFSNDHRSLLVETGFPDDSYADVPVDRLTRWDVNTGEVLEDWDIKVFNPVSVSPLKKWMITVVDRSQILIWDHQRLYPLHFPLDERFDPEISTRNNPTPYFYQEDSKLILTTYTHVFLWDMVDVLRDENAEPRTLTFDVVSSFSLSEDGSLMIINNQLWETDTLQMIGQAGLKYTGFTPDGHFILSHDDARNTNVLIDVSTFAETLLLNDLTTVRFNPVLPYLVYLKENGVRVVDLTTTDEIELPINGSD